MIEMVKMILKMNSLFVMKMNLSLRRIIMGMIISKAIQNLIIINI